MQYEWFNELYFMIYSIITFLMIMYPTYYYDFYNLKYYSGCAI